MKGEGYHYNEREGGVKGEENHYNGAGGVKSEDNHYNGRGGDIITI